MEEVSGALPEALRACVARAAESSAPPAAATVRLERAASVAHRALPPIPPHCTADSDALLLFIAFPAWFVLLALALKKVDSIESMNVGLFTNAEAEDAKRRELAMGGAPAATEPAAPPPTAL